MAEQGERRPWFVKYDGHCARCGLPLLKGTPAVWERRSKSIRCIECPNAPPETATAEQSADVPVDGGIAGASARREYERRATKREAEARERWGERIGGWVLRLSAEPQATRAWGIGAVGEERLARALEVVTGIRVLHDRRVPRTRGNIDHLVVGPAGVFVVDAKHYQGLIRIRDRGSFFRHDYRLYVGRRDCSKLADGLAWQVEAVIEALRAASVDVLPPITPVLCFIDGEWPLFRAPDEFRGVRLEGPRSIARLMTTPVLVDEGGIDESWHVLAKAFPPKERRE